MGKWSDITEFEINQLCQYRWWVENQEVDATAKQVVLTVVERMLAELRKRPRPPPIDGYPVFELSELVCYRRELESSDMAAPIRDVLAVLVGAVIEEIG